MRALEERGIGRPSTYASIIGTILDRGYVFKRGTALVPSFLAFSVVALLEQHFGKLVDYDFTARMEDDLDRIADGDEQRVEWLKRFYFGERRRRRASTTSSRDQLAEIDARDINSIPIGNGITLRVGRYGPYLEREDKRVSVPDDMPPDELTVEAAEALLAKPSGDLELGVNPGDGADRRRARRPLRPVRLRAAAGGLRGEAPDVVALQVDVARDGDARRRAAPALAAARPRRVGRRGDHRAERPLRPVRPEGKGLAVARVGGAAPHDHARARRSSSSSKPKERRRPRRGRRRRCARSAPTRRLRRRSWSATAASAPTSPTARRTRACAAATTPNR